MRECGEPPQTPSVFAMRSYDCIVAVRVKRTPAFLRVLRMPVTLERARMRTWSPPVICFGKHTKSITASPRRTEMGLFSENRIARDEMNSVKPCAWGLPHRHKATGRRTSHLRVDDACLIAHPM